MSKHLTSLPDEQPLLPQLLMTVTETEHWSLSPQNHLTFFGTHYAGTLTDGELLELSELLTAWKEKRAALRDKAVGN